MYVIQNLDNLDKVLAKYNRDGFTTRIRIVDFCSYAFVETPYGFTFAYDYISWSIRATCCDYGIKVYPCSYCGNTAEAVTENNTVTVHSHSDVSEFLNFQVLSIVNPLDGVIALDRCLEYVDRMLNVHNVVAELGVLQKNMKFSDPQWVLEKGELIFGEAYS
jgi:hypothetical protein